MLVSKLAGTKRKVSVRNMHGELLERLTASTAADIVFGVIRYRMLTSADPVDLALISARRQ